MDQKVSAPATVSTLTKTIPVCDQLHQNTDIISVGGLAGDMEPSSPLGALGVMPTELIFRILDFMHLYQYCGFPCTCQRALALVNQKLEVGEYCVTSLPDWKSATAPYVNMQSLTIPPSEIVYPWNVSACCGHPEEDDEDL